jgi:hypothetical protein
MSDDAGTKGNAETVALAPDATEDKNLLSTETTGDAKNGDDQPGDSQPGAEQEPEKGKEPRWYRENLKRFNREKLELAEKAKRLEKEAEEARQETIKAKKELEAKAAPATMPRSDDFETHEEFSLAMTNWALDQRERTSKVSADADQEKAAKAEEARQYDDAVAKSYNEGVKKFGDEFAEKVAAIPGSILNVDVLKDVLAADSPADVLNFLANNLDKAADIAGLSQRKRAVAIGRIEARLSAAPAKKTTNATPPITPVSGTSPGVPDEKNLSDDEWWKRRKAARAHSG